MKTFRIESYERAMHDAREMFEQELDKLRAEHDDAMTAIGEAADEAAEDAAAEQYKRIGWAISDIKKLLDALYDAEQAFGGLECDNEQVLKRMGLI